MAHHAFGRANRDPAKKVGDGPAFGRVVKRGGRSVCVDVIDFLRRQPSTRECPFHRLTRADSRGMGLGEVVVIGRNAVAADFPEDRSAAGFGRRPILQRQKRRAFPENEAAARAVEGPAFLRR